MRVQILPVASSCVGFGWQKRSCSQGSFDCLLWLPDKSSSAGFSFEGVGRGSPCRTWSQLWLPNSGLQPLLCVPEFTCPYAASGSHLPDGWQSWQFLRRVSSRLFWGVISGGPTQSSLLQPPFQQFCKHLVRIKSVFPVPCTDTTDEQNTINNSVPRNLKT